MTNLDLAQFSLDSLPSIPLSNKSELPDVAGIYFAIDSLGTIQYIGRSVNIKQRWAKHHRQPDLADLGVKIAWLVVEPAIMLSIVEIALISWFNPPLNGAKIVCPTKPVKPKLADKAISVRLFSDSYDYFLEMAQNEGKPPTILAREILERFIKENSDNQDSA